MTKFTPYEYLLIAIANANGMDKALWNERIEWADNFTSQNTLKQQLEYAAEECIEEPIIMAKAIKAHDDVMEGKPTGFLCNLDATASGIQIMSAITGCWKGAEKVNLVNNGKRNDIYSDMAEEMNANHSTQVDRSMMKSPIMTTFYGSTAQPTKLFGKGTPELKAFFSSLATGLPGAYELLNCIQGLQDSTATYYEWKLPDGHTAYIPVMETVDKKVEIAELNKATFTFRTKVNQPKDFDLSLAANVVHSIDGYIVRQLFRRAKANGYQMTAIHDSFWASPNHIQDVRIGYTEELAKLAESTIIQDILNQICGNPNGYYAKHSDNLADAIREADYALS